MGHCAADQKNSQFGPLNSIPTAVKMINPTSDRVKSAIEAIRVDPVFLFNNKAYTIKSAAVSKVAQPSLPALD